MPEPLPPGPSRIRPNGRAAWSKDYSSLGGGARYAFEADEAADRDFRIAEAGTDRLLGIKRFRNTAAAVFDIAPYLRDRFRFEPGGGPTGFANADGRCVAATVATDGATAAVRTFLRGTAEAGAPALRTSQPHARLLGHDECDEITLVTTAPCTAAVTVRSGGTVSRTDFADSGTGVRLFRLDAADFPGRRRSQSRSKESAGSNTGLSNGRRKRAGWPGSDAQDRSNTTPSRW